MKKQAILKSAGPNATDIFLVVSGWPGPGNESVHLVTFDHKKALGTAKKLVRREKRIIARRNIRLEEEKDHDIMQRETGKQETSGYGEVYTDHWYSEARYVNIVLFRIDKEYIPAWMG